MGGGAQRPVWRDKKPKKTGAHARTKPTSTVYMNECHFKIVRHLLQVRSGAGAKKKKILVSQHG
jgi:hypothetical protein